MPEEARRKGFVAEIRVFSSRGAGWLIAKYAVGCHIFVERYPLFFWI
jgi:hypothetical protein